MKDISVGAHSNAVYVCGESVLNSLSNQLKFFCFVSFTGRLNGIKRKFT